jgi:hypothetical protein
MPMGHEAHEVPMGMPLEALLPFRDDSQDQSASCVQALAEPVDVSDEFMAQVRMFEAAYQGQWSYVKAFLDHKTEWVNGDNPLGSQAGYKLVHQAAYYGCGLPVLSMLATKGANFLEVNARGETPVAIARAHGKARCAVSPVPPSTCLTMAPAAWCATCMSLDKHACACACACHWPHVHTHAHVAGHAYM